MKYEDTIFSVISPDFFHIFHFGVFLYNKRATRWHKADTGTAVINAQKGKTHETDHTDSLCFSDNYPVVHFFTQPDLPAASRKKESCHHKIGKRLLANMPSKGTKHSGTR